MEAWISFNPSGEPACCAKTKEDLVDSHTKVYANMASEADIKRMKESNWALMKQWGWTARKCRIEVLDTKQTQE